jgi:hypothetical protein
LGQEGLHVRLLCRYYADAANTLDALRYSVPLKAMKRVVQAALDMGGRPVPKDSVLAYMLDELDEEWSGGKDRASTCDDGTAQRIRTEENHPLLRQKPDKERSYDIRIEVRVDADETAVVFDDNTGFMMRLAEAAEERMKSAGRDSRPSTRYSFVDGRRASIAGPRSSMAAERGSFLPPAQDFSMEMYRCLEEEIRFVVELKKKYRK